LEAIKPLAIARGLRNTCQSRAREPDDNAGHRSGGWLPYFQFMPEMDEQHRRIREARLLVSRPEDVFEELKRYAEQIKSGTFSAVDEQLEKSLAGRTDPLIDLGLARFGSDKDIVGELYEKALAPAKTAFEARYRKGLRIACLSNQSVPIHHAIEFPVIGRDETRRVLAEADEDEVEALICNPYGNDNLLRALFERGEPFSEFDEERWRRVILYSCKNSRLVNENDNEYAPDLQHGNIHKALFNLLRIAPATSAWITPLYALLENLDPKFCIWTDKIDDVLERWKSVSVDDYKGRPREGYFTAAPLRDEFRCLIAALYGEGLREKEGIVIHGFANASDVALRCAYYGNAELTAKDMKEGHERDRGVFVFAVLFNDHVYLASPLRKLLEETFLTGNLKARYRHRCEQLHKHYPNFDPHPSAEWMTHDTDAEDERNPAKKLTGWAATMDTKVADLAKLVGTIKQWLVWGFIIIGALILFRR
jgi:hypothetical protein